jgi:putative aldouronate transport system substrate-binding protein
MGTCTKLARRLVTLVLCLAVITVSMGAPGSTGNPAAKAAASTAPIPITFFASPDLSIVNLNTNWYTKYVEQKFNLKITWSLVPSTDVTTKENVLLGSGSYPQVFYSASFTIPQVYKYAKEGIFVPMESYFQKYAPHLWHAIQTEPGLKQAITAPDGHIYGFPAYNVCIHCYYSAKFWIDVQKLHQYGLQMPTTTAQFEHVLQVFKQHGLIPLTGAATNAWHGDPVTFLMNAFIYDDGGPLNNGSYFYINNGKIAFAPIQPQWKAGLQYLHDLWSKGLIDQGAFSQDNSVLQKEVVNGKVGVVPWGCANCFDPNYPKDVNRWRTIPPLTGPAGVRYASFYGNNPGSPIVFAVTNKATDAQKIAVAKMLDEIATVRGQELKMFGPQSDGLWTAYPKGVKDFSGHPAFLTIDEMKWNSPNFKQNWGWYQMGPMYQPYSFRYGQDALPPYAPGGVGAESMLQLETELNYVGLQPKYVVPGSLWIDPSSLNQYTLEQTNINDYVNQWLVEFITGTKSLTSDWNSYVQGVQNLGLPQYLQTAQTAMGTPMNTMAGTLFKKNWATIHYLQSLK